LLGFERLLGDGDSNAGRDLRANKGDDDVAEEVEADANDGGDEDEAKEVADDENEDVELEEALGRGSSGGSEAISAADIF